MQYTDQYEMEHGYFLNVENIFIHLNLTIASAAKIYLLLAQCSRHWPTLNQHWLSVLCYPNEYNMSWHTYLKNNIFIANLT